MTFNTNSFLEVNSKKEKISNELFQLMSKLFPICRSITGDGVRKSLSIIAEQIPLKIQEIESGTKVYDWIVPDEWNITDAYIKDSKGNKIVDFKNSNLHIVSYSIPKNSKLTLEKLKPHLFSLPEKPNSIPYVTSYYNKNWGFCLTDNQLSGLQDDGEYEIFINSSLRSGHLTYGEFVIPGETTDEVLITCYICHPSLCNDNLSGIALLTFLSKYLNTFSLKFTYRFLFIPETIGSIVWLHNNESHLHKIKHGLVATCLGDSGCFTYKKTRSGNNEIDKIVECILKNSNDKYDIVDFFPFGSDERQFCSPGFDLPVGSLMRTPYLKFPEYHTSDDNLNFVKKEKLLDSFLKYLEIIFVIENNKKFENLNPKCEPNLGKRGLYSLFGAENKKEDKIKAISWLLNFSDGEHSLLDISLKSEMPFVLLLDVANLLVEKKLLKEIKSSETLL
jgi:aminopeptidase-like protein